MLSWVQILTGNCLPSDLMQGVCKRLQPIFVNEVLLKYTPTIELLKFRAISSYNGSTVQLLQRLYGFQAPNAY